MSEQLTFTRGPWLLRQFQGRTYVLDAIPDVGGKVVANIIATPNTNPAWEANAALIAAAPDLLAALEPLLAAVAESERESRLRIDVGPPHLRHEVTLTRGQLAAIAAAVAKAKVRCDA